MSAPSPRPTRRTSELDADPSIPRDATEQAVRVHEAAALLADRSGLSKAAEGHRDLVVRMRNGRARAAKGSRM